MDFEKKINKKNKKGMIQGLTTIFKAEGVRGLWNGANGAMLRTMIGKYQPFL